MLVISATKVSSLDIVYATISIVFTQNFYLVIFVESQGWTRTHCVSIRQNIIKHCQDHSLRINIVLCPSFAFFLKKKITFMRTFWGVSIYHSFKLVFIFEPIFIFEVAFIWGLHLFSRTYSKISSTYMIMKLHKENIKRNWQNYIVRKKIKKFTVSSFRSPY